jgi:hypothetical protein
MPIAGKDRKAFAARIGSLLPPAPLPSPTSNERRSGHPDGAAETEADQAQSADQQKSGDRFHHAPMARKPFAAISESRTTNHTTDGNSSNHLPPAPDAALKSFFINSPLTRYKASKKAIKQGVSSIEAIQEGTACGLEKSGAPARRLRERCRSRLLDRAAAS